MIVSVSLGVLTCWFPLHLKAIFFPLISADYLTHYDKKRTKYMDACYFMDILRKWFIIQLNPSTLCLKGKRKDSSGPFPSSKNSAKSLLLPFLSNFNFLANIARQTKQFISVLYVAVNVEESILQLGEFYMRIEKPVFLYSFNISFNTLFRLKNPIGVQHVYFVLFIQKNVPVGNWA